MLGWLKKIPFIGKLGSVASGVAGMIGPKVFAVAVLGLGAAIWILWGQLTEAQEERATYKASFEKVAEQAVSNAQAAHRFKRNAEIQAKAFQQRTEERRSATQQRRQSEADLREGKESAEKALRECLGRDLNGDYYRGLWPQQGPHERDRTGPGVPRGQPPDGDPGGTGPG